MPRCSAVADSKLEPDELMPTAALSPLDPECLARGKRFDVILNSRELDGGAHFSARARAGSGRVLNVGNIGLRQNARPRETVFQGGICSLLLGWGVF